MNKLHIYVIKIDYIVVGSDSLDLKIKYASLVIVSGL